MGDPDGVPVPDELADGLGGVLEHVVTLFRSLNAANPLSRSASGALGALERNGPTRLTTLAARDGVTQPAMTQLVSRLEGTGLVRREPDPDDGRVVRVVITDNGLAMLAARRAERTERLAALLSRIGPAHRAALAAALPALEALYEAHADSQVPA
ncbi:MAG: MarR family transcriptional regulator [Nocardiopsaceae bacterium]|nr:MarR family transcriptional regulator [Nocardiopsaceae bacterium]